ncbi:hypothetical protein MTO96_040639 [Rhipicephalus appendiculatus]
MAKRNAARKQGGATVSQPTDNVQRQTTRRSPPGKTSTRPPGSRQRSQPVVLLKSTSPPGALAAMSKGDDTAPAPGRPSHSQVQKRAPAGTAAKRGRAAANAATKRAGKTSRRPSHSEPAGEVAVATAEPLVEAAEKKNLSQPKRKQLGRSCVTANDDKNVVVPHATAENTPSRPEAPSAPAAVNASQCHQRGQGPPANYATASASGDGRKFGNAAKAPK